MVEIRWTDEQRRAIEHRDGPLRIIAGAGSGKTATMTEHIVELIRSGRQRADQIVALTFTNAAADELTHRIRDSLNDSAISVWSGTYHAFGMQVIRDGALALGLPANPRLFSPAESWLIIRDILREGIQLEQLDVTYRLSAAINQVRDFISRCKDELVTPEHVAEYLATLPEEDAIHAAQMRDFHRLYAAYQERCLRLGGIDFGDQIALAVRALILDDELVADYRDRYRAFIVDEYQDTNYAQSVFVELLSAPDYQARIVGDPNQSIYRFRGAAVDNIQRFSEEIPNVVDVSLTTNFRSHQCILDLANRLVSDDASPGGELRALNGRTGPIPIVADGETHRDEASWIADTIAAHRESADGDEPPAVAVLIRKRKLLPDIASALGERDLPYQVYGDRTVFDSAGAQDVIAMLEILSDPDDQRSIVRVLTSQRYGMHHRSIYELKSRLVNSDFFASLIRLTSQPTDDLPVEMRDSLKRFCDDLRQIHHRTSGLPVDAFVREISALHAGNFSQFDLQATHHLEQMAVSFSYNQIDPSLPAFVQYLRAIEDLGAEEAAIDAEVETDAVALMTVHGAKGLEFDVVIIAGVNERDFTTAGQSSLGPVPPALLHNAGIYPPRSNFADRDEYEKAVTEIEKQLDYAEERRLFYVAITRAREHLYFGWSKLHPTRAKPTRIYPMLAELLDLTRDAEIPSVPSGRQSAPILTFFEQSAIQLDPADEFAGFRDTWAAYWRGTPEEERALQALDSGFERFLAGKAERDQIAAGLREVRRNRPYQPLPPDLYSYSLIDTYERCPRLYMYRYVLGLPAPPVEHTYTDLGSRFHEALHHAHISRSGNPREDFLRAFAADLGDAEASGNGHASVARLIVEEYLQSDDIEAEALAVEPEFFLKLAPGSDGAVIYGLIDRIQRRPDGTIEIVDYKTHRTPKTRDEVLADLQLPIYVMGAREALGYDPAYATMAFIRHSRWLRFRTDELDLPAARDRITRAITGIRAHNYTCTCSGTACRTDWTPAPAHQDASEYVPARG